MLIFTPSTENHATAQVKLRRRVKDLDEWQSRLVLAFINKLFGPGTLTADEMEAAT